MGATGKAKVVQRRDLFGGMGELIGQMSEQPGRMVAVFSVRERYVQILVDNGFWIEAVSDRFLSSDRCLEDDAVAELRAAGFNEPDPSTRRPNWWLSTKDTLRAIRATHLAMKAVFSDDAPCTVCVFPGVNAA